MKSPHQIGTKVAFFVLAVIATKTDAVSIRNKIVKTVNGTVQTVVDGTVDVTLPIKSETSTVRRVWISYERGQLVSVLGSMEASRLVATHMTPIYDFPSMSSVVTMATDEEIAALMANSTIGPINVTDDPKRYPMVHATKYLRDGQRHLQDGQTVPYGISLTQVDQLWQATGLTGEGVTVCVVDSGLDISNPDFDTTGYTGISLVAGGVWDSDSSGHGTHVTGIISASNNGIGVVGAAPSARIHTIDVFGDDGFAYASALVDAAFQCRDAGAKIISMSLGGGAYSDQENNLFTELYNFNGILSVAAAGNEGNDLSFYPASYDSVLSVGAIDSSKTLASFSNFNDRVDLVAPGVDVLSTLPSSACDICSRTGQSTYGSVSGTSQATPYVSGIAALLWSYDTTLGVEMIYNALTTSGEDLGDAGRDNFYGNGLVSALAAYNVLTSSSGGTPPPASAPVADGEACVYASMSFLTDNFPYETKIKLSDVSSGSVLWYGGATTANTVYTLPSTCLNPSGCYFFEIFDQYGDGLCCAFGEGYFELTVDNVVVASGNSFGSYYSYSLGSGCQA